jgi:pimeloyl-ACP methyl ester carboxylesterase
MRTLLMLPLLAVACYLALVAFVYATQRSQIYFPTPESRAPHAQALWIESEGERIKVWVMARPGSRALIYFGGNAEDVAGNIDVFQEAFPDRSLFLVNYRGYGGSSGRSAEPGLRADALAIFDHVRRQHAEIAVMGRSLGSGVAVQLATARPVERLVLVTAYDSLVNVAREYFWWLPVGLLLRDRYESATRAKEVEAPVLIVVAAEDEIISRARSEALAAAFTPGQVQIEVVPGVGHNTLDWSPAYLEAVRRFLATTVVQ